MSAAHPARADQTTRWSSAPGPPHKSQKEPWAWPLRSKCTAIAMGRLFGVNRVTLPVHWVFRQDRESLGWDLHSPSPTLSRVPEQATIYEEFVQLWLAACPGSSWHREGAQRCWSSRSPGLASCPSVGPGRPGFVVSVPRLHPQPPSSQVVALVGFPKFLCLLSQSPHHAHTSLRT